MMVDLLSHIYILLFQVLQILNYRLLELPPLDQHSLPCQFLHYSQGKRDKEPLNGEKVPVNDKLMSYWDRTMNLLNFKELFFWHYEEHTHLLILLWQVGGLLYQAPLSHLMMDSPTIS